MTLGYYFNRLAMTVPTLWSYLGAMLGLYNSYTFAIGVMLPL